MTFIIWATKKGCAPSSDTTINGIYSGISRKGKALIYGGASIPLFAFAIATKLSTRKSMIKSIVKMDNLIATGMKGNYTTTNFNALIGRRYIPSCEPSSSEINLPSRKFLIHSGNDSLDIGQVSIPSDKTYIAGQKTIMIEDKQGNKYVPVGRSNDETGEYIDGKNYYYFTHNGEHYISTNPESTIRKMTYVYLDVFFIILIAANTYSMYYS
jgi:hypothetical protein